MDESLKCDNKGKPEEYSLPQKTSPQTKRDISYNEVRYSAWFTVNNKSLTRKLLASYDEQFEVW